MERNNIRRAILQPTNDPYMYFPARKTNEFLAQILEEHPDRFLAFADINLDGSYILDKTPAEFEYAIKDLGLHGLKIHPSNLNVDADDLRLVPLLRKAAELKIPVIYHGNPCMTGFHDNCAPDKFNKMIKYFPIFSLLPRTWAGSNTLMHGQDAPGLTFLSSSRNF